MRKDSLKKFIMVFLAVVLFLQPLSAVLVFAKGFTNKNSSIKMISEKLDMEEVLSEEISDDSPKHTNLTIYPIGELPKDIDSEIVLISKSGERFSKIIRDNKPVKFEGLLHDIYDAELFYTNQNGEEIQSTRRFDLRDESKNAFEFDLPTNMLQWTHGEVEISPNFQEIELFSPKSEEVVEKLFLETEIQGDELILRGVKEEDMDSKTHKEDFIMHVYDSEKDEAFDIVGKELELSKEEKKKYGKRIYESDYKINLKELKSNELEVDFLRGENQSYIQKIYLNNLGYEDYKNSIEKSENEEASNKIDGLAINDEEIFKLDGLSPMIMMRSLSPRGAGNTWDVTPKTVTGTNIDITDVSVKEGTNNSLVWTVVVNQKAESIFSHYYHHFMPDKAGGNVVPKEIKNSGAIMQTIADWGDSYYSRSDRSLKKGLYTYTITTDIPTGNTGKLPFKVVLGNSDNNGPNSNKGNVSSILTATKQIVNKNFNFIVKDNSSPASIVNGAVIKLTDDSGKEVQGTTGANGKVALQGEFTADTEYVLTVVSVPDGYKIPSPNTVRVKYSPTTANPNESTDVTVNIEKIETPTIEAKFENATITDADIGLEIYSGLEATGTPIKTITIPKGNKVPIEGLVNGQQYTIKVVSSNPDLYETGATTSFTFNDQEPHIVVNLTKKTSENKLVVNFHEDSVDGPLTNKLDGQVLKLSVNGEEVIATITNGVATFMNPAQGTYTLVDPAPSVEGYKLVSNASFNLNNTNGYQDWYIVKKGTKVSLEVKPPVGKTFPADMTVKLVDASNNIVKGPVSIGNGNLIFEDIPWGNGYQFIYENVPENWTHSGAMAKPFDIPENAEETKVTDQFGYNDPASDKSQISIKVVDNDNKPVQGFEFQIKDSNNNLVATVVSGTDGIAKTEVAKLAPGTYTVENTKRPAGYLKVDLPSVKLTDKKYNIAADVIAGKDGTQNQSNVYINVKDINGKAVPSEWLEFYKVNNTTGKETKVTDELQTDEHGDTYIAPLNVEDGYKYKIKLKANSNYKLIKEIGQTEDIVIEKMSSKQINIKVDIKDGLGKITAFTHTSDGKPAPNLNIKIKKKGAITNSDSFLTLYDGKNTSKFLENGTYEVSIEESPIYKLADGEEATKTITISNDNKQIEVEFIVEQKAPTIDNAGSIEIEGFIIKNPDGPGYKASHTATFTKDASNSPTKRGFVNTIRIKADELISPSKPILRVKINDGEFEEKAVNGTWIRDGEYYVFKDNHAKDSDLNSDKIIYEYSFTSTGVDSAEKYTADASAIVKTSNPAENIAVNPAELVLNKDDIVEGGIDITTVEDTTHGVAEGQFSTVHWNYDATVKVVAPGTHKIKWGLPSNSGIKPFDKNTLKPVIKFLDKDGESLDTPPKYEIVFDKASGDYKIDIHWDKPGEYKINIQHDTDIDRESEETDYRLNVNNSYIMDTFPDTENHVGDFTVYAPGIQPVPGKTTSSISPCEDGKHKIDIAGQTSPDGKKILWTVKATNLDPKRYSDLESIHPMTLDITVGEGLGDAKLVSLNSIGKTFPYVRNSITGTGEMVSDNTEKSGISDNAGKAFSVRADFAPSHFISRFGDSHTNSRVRYAYKYITKASSVGIYAGPFMIKEDLIGNEYFWHRKNGVGIVGKPLDKASGSNFQRLAAGEYMVATFETPIEDFSLGNINASGYTVSVNSTSYHYDDVKKTDSPQKTAPGEICKDHKTSLTLKNEKGQADEIITKIYKDGVGEVIATGKYNEEGTAIDWNIEIKPLLSAVANFGDRRDIKVNYQLVNENNQSIDTGLEDIINREMEKIESTGYLIKMDVSEKNNTGNSGTIEVKNMRASELVKYSFSTPLIPGDPKPVYKLKVEAFHGSKFNEPLQEGDTPDANIDYVIVPGKSMKINVFKKWENVTENSEKPNVKLILQQIDFNDNIKNLAEVNKSTPASDDEFKYVFETYTDASGQEKPIPRFNEEPGPLEGTPFRYNVIEVDGDGNDTTTLADYDSHILKGNVEGSLWNLKNVKKDILKHVENPVEYVNEKDGTYPKKYQQDGPDIRNADTKELNTKGENYKVEYEDSIVGKSGQQTDVPGMFDMKLTMEGKSKLTSGDLDVVFVIDNSYSMGKDFNGNIAYNNESRRVTIAHDAVVKMTNQVLDDNPNNRVGIVNFSTLSQRLSEYPASPQTQHGEPIRYHKKDIVPLTTSKNDVKDGIPVVARRSSLFVTRQEDGFVNSGTKYDQMTNIVAGINKGTEILYGSGNTGRQKLMILLTDGLPTASYKIKNFPLDTTKSFKENISPTLHNMRYPEESYGLMVTNRTKFFPIGHSKLDYYTDNGILIQDHVTPTIAVADYQKAKHPDMEIVTVGIAPDFVQKESVLKADEIEHIFRSLSTDYNQNYYPVENEKELNEYIDTFAQTIKTKSIINGEVIDPMGDQIILKDKGNFKPATSAEFADGDYFLSDNFGNYLAGFDSNGDAIIGNKIGDPKAFITANVKVYNRDSIQRPIVQNNNTSQNIRIDQNGHPIKFQLNGDEHHNNVNSDGTYQYVLALHHDRFNPDTPPSGLPYKNGRDFTVVESLKQAVNYINGGYRLVLVENAKKGLNASGQLSTVGKDEKNKVEAVREDKNLLNGVTVTRVGKTIKINGLNLGTNEEVTLQYRIHLDTEDPRFVSDFYYQANKETTLNAQPAKGEYIRYFPIPSVKGPHIPIEVKKFWFIDMTGIEGYDGPPGIVDLNHWVDINGAPITQPQDQNKKIKWENVYKQKLTEYGSKPIIGQIYRYEAKTDQYGRPIYGEDGQPIIDETITPTLVREAILNDANSWTYQTIDLPAYNKNGVMYIYEVKEKGSVDGFMTDVVVKKPKVSYSKAEGYIVGENPDCEEIFHYDIMNTKVEEPMGSFEIKKVDKTDNTKVLPGAIFTISKKNAPTNEGIVKITGEDGMVGFGNLDLGEYILKETKAPPGYVLKAPEYTVKVGPELIEDTNKYKISIKYKENGEEKELKPINADTNSFVYQIDNESMELPNTGYTPGFPITLFALAIVILMAAFYIYKVNTKEVSDSN